MSDWVSALLGKLYVSGIEQPLRGGLEIAGDLALTPSARGYQLDVKPGRTLREQDSNLVVGTSGAAGLPTPIDPETITHTRGAHTRQGVVPFATTSDLRAVTPVAGRVAETVDAVTAGDGGGGQWEAFAGSPGTWTHNGIDTLVPASGTGSDGSRAWVRKNHEFLTPEMAGCTGSGDELAKLQALCDRAAVRGLEIVCSKMYTTSPILLTSAHHGLKLRAAGPDCGFISTGISKCVLFADGADDLVLDGLVIQGNNTGTGTGGDTADAGDGISILGDRASVCYCKFRNIGVQGAGSASSINIVGDDVHVFGNHIDDTCYSHAGADIRIAGARGFIGANQSINSNADSAITLVGDDNNDEGRHICSFNVITRNNDTPYGEEDSGPRHGILAQYGNGRGRCTLIGNQISGTTWTGIYVTGGNDPGDEVGRHILSDNVVQYCGGGYGTTGLKGGMHLTEIPGGAIVHDNIVLFSGIAPNGDVRLEPTVGIKVARNSRNVLAHDNLVVGCTAQGMSLEINSGLSEYCTFHHNHCAYNGTWDNGVDTPVLHAQMIFAVAGAGLRAKDITLEHNTCITDIDYHGIQLAFSSASGNQQVSDIHVDDNKVICEAVSSTVGYGVYWPNATSGNTGTIQRNKPKGFSNGVYVNGSDARACPAYVRVEDTDAEDCTTAVRVPTGSFSIGTRARNCTNIIASPSRWEARSTGFTSGVETFELFGSTAPTAGTFVTGDSMFDPATGVRIVCTTGGAPGTWVYASGRLAANAQTGTTYTPVLADGARDTTLSNAAAIAVTIPTNTAVPFQVGTVLVLLQIGAGLVTATGDTGVTINGTSGGAFVSAGQWKEMRLRKTATNTWVAVSSL